MEFVSQVYRLEFVKAYDQLFEYYPQEIENYRYHSIMMRRIFGRRKRVIPLLHRNGMFYKITPRNGRLRWVDSQTFTKYGPYHIATIMPFPDEGQ